MKYELQHTGRGKYHLLDAETLKELCGTKGVLLWNAPDDLLLENDKFYEVDKDSIRTFPLPDILLKAHYCQKCIKKAKALANQNK